MLGFEVQGSRNTMSKLEEGSKRGSARVSVLERNSVLANIELNLDNEKAKVRR